MKKPRISLRGTKTIIRLISSVGINLVFIINLFSQSSTFQLAPLFQDNMVLQQQRSAPIWGKGIPGTNVIIKTSWGKSVSTVVDTGRQVDCFSFDAESRRPIPDFHTTWKFSSRVKKRFNGGSVVMLGQSNMEMPLEGWPPADTIMNSTRMKLKDHFIQLYGCFL